ncbi:MAG: TIGR00266 family protein [Thermoplasmata archaeon]|nr:MAG: TIGR00266 family protein [Thermoplasmata archaeon]
MRYKITGDNLQIVTLEIAPNELIYAEAGAMIHISGNINMQAKARGGIMKGLKRMLTGETFFLTEFTSQGGTGICAFAGNAPGTIKPIPLGPGKDFLCQKDAFLCAENTIEMDMAFQQKLGASFFGGEGFIIQRLSGSGTAFIHACGDFVEMDLQPGQVIKVDTGNVVGWDSSVTYDIERVKGIKTMFFGGEGLFLTTLKGPGKIILQSMTLHNLATALSPFLPQQSSGRSSGGASFLGQ